VRVSDVFRQRMRTLRRSRGWSQQQLAMHLVEFGAMTASKGAVAKIENGSRNVLLEEAIQIAAALDVGFARMLVPLEPDVAVELTPTQQVTSRDLRRWIQGLEPLPRGDIRPLLADMTRGEFLVQSDSALGGFNRGIEAIAEAITNDNSMTADDAYDEIDRLLERLLDRGADRYALLPERLEARRKAKESRSRSTKKASRKKPR
jgi:transcriptional regulator with XRE-family HTH domain